MDKVNKQALDTIFREARTYSAWLDKPVSDELLHEVYEVMKWGPTSANCCPARFVFLRSVAAKERLRSALSPGNVEKTMAAPVTIIIGYDLKFYEKLTKLFPHNPGMRDLFASNPQLVEATAQRNSTLRGAYFMLAARARWASTVGQCQALITQRWMRNFSQRARNVKDVSRSSFRPVT